MNSRIRILFQNEAQRIRNTAEVKLVKSDGSGVYHNSKWFKLPALGGY